MSDWKQQAIELAKQGKSWRSIAKILNKPKSSVSDYLRENFKNGEVVQYTPKVLLLDIETAPTSAYVWSRWKQNIYQEQVISEGFILCFAAKFLGSDQIVYEKIAIDLLPYEDDFEVVSTLYELLNIADVVIAHNGKAFDIATINTRLVYHGFTPPTSYKIIDTLQIARKEFRFPSNKLDSLGQYLGVGKKVEHEGFKLWKDCLAGDDEAWLKMEEYNIQDVELLEQVYLKLRAWDKSHPNMSLYTTEDIRQCTCCGSLNIEATGNYVYTNISKFEEFQCLDCGTISRARKNKAKSKQKLVKAQ